MVRIEPVVQAAITEGSPAFSVTATKAQHPDWPEERVEGLLRKVFQQNHMFRRDPILPQSSPPLTDDEKSLIRANLRLSVEQRLKRHDAALKTLNKLRAAVRGAGNSQ